LIKIIIKEENFKWHLEAFASELFIWTSEVIFYCLNLSLRSAALSRSVTPSSCWSHQKSTLVDRLSWAGAQKGTHVTNLLPQSRCRYQRSTGRDSCPSHSDKH